MQLQIEDFSRLFPGALNAGEWVVDLNKYMPKYGIDTLPRISAFLAQCGHESIGFTVLSENLNYSAKALTATWPKRFPAQIAEGYARKPEMIANRAYADRMGNGPEESGDGWRFRGKGIIQITGCDNHAAFSEHAGVALAVVGGYLLTFQGAVHSACWFWEQHNCNALADAGDIVALTKSINGGINGLDDRKARYAQAREIITA